MLITTAREVAAESVLRNGSYDPTDASHRKRLDYAIQSAGDEFVSRVRPFVESKGPFTMAAGDSTVATIGVNPLRVKFVTAQEGSGPEVPATIIRHEDMLRLRSDYPLNLRPMIWPYMATSRGRMVSFDPSNATIYTYGTAGVAIDFRVAQNRMFTTWTAGDAAPVGNLDIPDEFVREFLYKGVPYYYDLVQASSDYVSRTRQGWEEFLLRAAAKQMPTVFILPVDPDRIS